MASRDKDEDFQYTREEVERLSDALKDKEFRKLFTDYCEEIQNPENCKLYQSEITQLEKERGVDITFFNPAAGYVIKTSVEGDKKAFINVCSNNNVEKPTFTVQDTDGKKGVCWRIPHVMAPPHDDLDNKKNKCVVYDVIFHPGTMKMAEKNPQFKKMLNNTACDAVESNYKVTLDRKNMKFPKTSYKGFAMASAIRKPIENFVKSEETSEDLEILESLYPQKIHTPILDTNIVTSNDVNHNDNKSPYTVPKYIIKQRRDIDMSEYTNDRDSGKNIALPSALVVEVKLPLLSSSAEAKLDVKNKHLMLISETPAKYKLDVNLPYAVNEEAGSAKFDISKRLLVITLPVVVEKMSVVWRSREDSGVESDCNSPCASDEDNNNTLVKEVLQVECIQQSIECDAYRTSNKKVNKFLNADVMYTVPPYTCHVLDNTVAFTIHVKNVHSESVVYELLPDNSSIQLKFDSIGAGYFPIHYAFFLKFPAGVECLSPIVEPWDNNVIMQVELSSGSVPDHCFIGLEEDSAEKKDLDIPVESILQNSQDDSVNQVVQPNVEVSARGNNEVNISLTVEELDVEQEKEETKENIIPIPQRVEDKCDPGIASSNGSSKGILKNRIPRIGRSFSESSVDWMDSCGSPGYSLSSTDCIPEESSSLKKTVRFSNVIAKQTFRSNSSILGQKSKNQRKKRNKKRAQERRSSEGDNGDREPGCLEAVSDENVFSGSDCGDENISKHRRDSGLADTDDGEPDKDDTAHYIDVKTSKIKEKLASFAQNNLSNGKYQEVKFKSDLIFDLDM